MLWSLHQPSHHILAGLGKTSTQTPLVIIILTLNKGPGQRTSAMNKQNKCHWQSTFLLLRYILHSKPPKATSHQTRLPSDTFLNPLQASPLVCSVTLYRQALHYTADDIIEPCCLKHSASLSTTLSLTTTTNDCINLHKTPKQVKGDVLITHLCQLHKRKQHCQPGEFVYLLVA